MSIDQRKSRRHSVDNGARIALDGDSSPQNCRMLDISAHGARLELETAATLTDKFMLLLSHDGGLRRECSVIWRTEKAVGITFNEPFPTRLRQHRPTQLGVAALSATLPMTPTSAPSSLPSIFSKILKASAACMFS